MKKRILIVDDEPEFTSMLKLTLESQGYYEVQEENSATAARQTAKFFDPDLMILDVMMPDMDGSELAASFKTDRLLCSVPVMFMTALADGTESGVIGDDGKFGGGQTVLPKGVATDRLIACIEDTLRSDAALAG